jgi:large conductance mechanosensitive channel
MGMLQEFREFAVRGNVVDMAVGVIMGAAFGKITTSLVNDVMMPPLGMALGGVDFSNKAVVLRAAEGADPGVMMKYGIFINAVIDFAIVALAVFLLVKGINTLRRQQAAAPAAPPAPTPTEVLLTEIRDTLRARA